MSWQFFDEDGDGVKTFREFFTVVSQLVFLGLAVFVVISEGLTSDERFTDVKFICIVSASLGASVFLEFLKLRQVLNNSKSDDEIITTTGEK